MQILTKRSCWLYTKWDKVESKIRSIIRDKRAKLFISQGGDYFEDRSCLGKGTKQSSSSEWWIHGYVYIRKKPEVTHLSIYFPVCLIDFKKMLLKGGSASSKMTWICKRAPTEVGTTRNPEPGEEVSPGFKKLEQRSCRRKYQG